MVAKVKIILPERQPRRSASANEAAITRHATEAPNIQVSS